MRELEFLPAWYPRLRRSRRRVCLQAWLTVAVILGLGLFLVLARRNIRAAEAALGSFAVQMEQTETEKRQLDDQLRIKTQLEQREAMVAGLGFPIEMSRLLATLDRIMPTEMSLKEITCTTVEQPVLATGAAAAQALPKTKPPLIDRRLNVRIVGVAPNDVDLANFLWGLQEYPFFEQLTVVKADEVIESGHRIREFEVTFTMSLTTTPG